jgi:ATP-dependent DNA helicase RecG
LAPVWPRCFARWFLYPALVPQTPLTLTTTLEDSRLIPPATLRGLRGLGIGSVGQLLAHLPTRHEQLEAETTIAELVPGAICHVRGEITATRPTRGPRPRFEAVLHDGTGRLDLVWFNQVYLSDKIAPGVRLRVQGKVAKRGPMLQMSNPRPEVLNPEDEPERSDGRIRPVYPASEDIASRKIEYAVQKILPAALPLVEDHLSPAFREQRALPELREAYRMLHAPQSPEEALAGRRRLAYDELLLLQLGVAMKRAHLRAHLRAPALDAGDVVFARIVKRLPFALTPGQCSVIEEIRTDLSQARPANRLIQGDVGSGKTAVALCALLMAVASKHQGALLAPTEILAEQHFASISKLLGDSKVRLALLTGSTPASEREATTSKLEAGELDIVVGTHALLSEDVRFRSLAVAIIDEQHRFGVAQRAQLRASASDGFATPHVLVMTATPIPRSLALTLFGDLDISTIRGLPPGRTPIETRVLSSHDRVLAYNTLKARIEAGEQGYVVVPAIDPTGVESPSGPLVDIRTVVNAMENGLLQGKRVAALHGQLERGTREAVMERFRSGVIDCLVATTVIEVGVDVPNASVMIVEHADRFGLAQLHQLRGRVGRGKAKGTCYLVADPTTPEGQARLAVMEQSSDGFVLAEKDLEIRGFGEVFGTRQSGLPPFRIADPFRDRELLLMARTDAQAMIDASPNLLGKDELLLRKRLMKAHGKSLALADVG